ncbi:MAG: hypothetical protein L0G99_17760, partial [Propionibacteriales bacterium]|nr:hypothetical protein [Propionibacteriales bacterium]
MTEDIRTTEVGSAAEEVPEVTPAATGRDGMNTDETFRRARSSLAQRTSGEAESSLAQRTSGDG